MLRIMSWNIERFGVNKLRPSDWDITGQRVQYLATTILAANPDVLVIIEVQTNAGGGFGGLISDTSGAPAVHALLWHLHANAAAGDLWAAVPPAIISPGGGYSEGVAVLFKSNRLTFEGPMLWTAAGIQPPPAAGIPPGLAIPYASPATSWAGTLPAAASQLGPNQDCLAGQFAFMNGAVRWGFPGVNDRSMWLTRFHAPPPVNRYLSIFSVHLPPAMVQARQALGEIGQVAEVAAAAPFGGAEDRVIIGDFNVNVNAAWQAAAFQQLTGGPAVLPVPACPQVYTLQFPAGAVASLRKVLDADTNGPAPYYGYAGTDGTGNYLGLDNALVWRSPGHPGLANNQVVINRVVGTPPPPAAANFPMDMVTGIPAIVAGIPPGGGRKARLNTLVNFGHIGGGRGASDHLPIVIELP